MDGGGHVGSECPGRGGPDQQRGVFVQQGESHEKAGVDYFLVAFGDYLVLREAGAAARTPGHDVPALVKPAAFVAPLEELPDGVVVLVRHRVVRVVPVHPVGEPLGLVGDDVREAADALFAEFHELVDAVSLDVALGLEAEFLFDLYLYPQPLPVESVLKALPVSLHVAEPQEQVLVGAAPCVVYAHGVVRRDGAVDERIALVRLRVALSVLARQVVVVPPLQDVALKFGEIYPGVDLLEHFQTSLNVRLAWCLFALSTSRAGAPPSVLCPSWIRPHAGATRP